MTDSYFFPSVVHTTSHSAHSPSCLVRFLDTLKKDLATSLVLDLHQFLSMFPLMRLVKKIFGKILHRHIIAGKVLRHGQVDTGSVELQVDLAVDGSLQVLVVVLVDL